MSLMNRYVEPNTAVMSVLRAWEPAASRLDDSASGLTVSVDWTRARDRVKSLPWRAGLASVGVVVLLGVFTLPWLHLRDSWSSLLAVFGILVSTPSATRVLWSIWGGDGGDGAKVLDMLDPLVVVTAPAALFAAVLALAELSSLGRFPGF